MFVRLSSLVVTLGVLAVVLQAARIDPRLATVRKAYVVPVDDLSDDKPVSACFADHLNAATPIEAVLAKQDADVVLRVKANVPSATKRVLVGAMGGSPSAH